MKNNIDADYTVSYTGSNLVDGKPVNVGEYEAVITVTGKGNYMGTITKTVSFKIAAKAVTESDVTITGLDNLVYDGQEKQAIVAIKAGVDADYEVTYEGANVLDGKAINAGNYTAVIKVTGQGDYAGEFTIRKDFTIEKGTYKLPETVTFEDLTVDYDGKAHEILAQNVPEGIKVSYENNQKTEMGVYQAKATFTIDTTTPAGQLIAKNYKEVKPMTMEAKLIIEKVTGIRVINAPTTLDFGKELPLANIELEVTSSNGYNTTTRRIKLNDSKCKVEYINNSLGYHDVTVTYKEQTTEFRIEVKDYVASITAFYDGIVNNSCPFGYALDSSKINVTLNYASGNHKYGVKDGLTIGSMPEKAITDTVEIAVSYQGMSTTLTITTDKPEIEYLKDNVMDKLEEDKPITSTKGVTIYAATDSRLPEGYVTTIKKDGQDFQVITEGTYILNQVGTYEIIVSFEGIEVAKGIVTIEAEKELQYELLRNADGTVYGIQVAPEDIDKVEKITITKRGGKVPVITQEMLRANNGKYLFTADQNGKGYTMTITVTEGKTPPAQSFEIVAQ